MAQEPDTTTQSEQQNVFLKTKYVKDYPGMGIDTKEELPWMHYWQYEDGEEGGELWLTNGEVDDFDGAFDLPDYVKDELRGLGYEVNF